MGKPKVTVCCAMWLLILKSAAIKHDDSTGLPLWSRDPVPECEMSFCPFCGSRFEAE